MYAVNMARAKSATAYTDPKRLQILKILEERGPLTQGQLAKITQMTWGTLQWHLYVLEREGRVKRVAKNGLVYYATPSHFALLEAE